MFEDWTTAVAPWVQANTVWAAPATFLIAFLESFPVISIVVPSTALLLAMGALIGSGLVDPWPVLLACAVGGILGDAAGYGLARVLGPTQFVVAFRAPAGAPTPGPSWSSGAGAGGRCSSGASLARCGP